MNISLQPDNYLVSLTTVSTAGCTGVALQDVTITGAPAAAFNPSTAYGAAPLTVQFANSSSGAVSYLWRFGTGDTSTLATPVYTYPDTGIYQVTLIAYKEPGCGDTTRQTIEVVEARHDLTLAAITPLEDGRLALTLRNQGSVTYNRDNLLLVFSFDNGAELTEPLGATLYPLTTLNHVPQLGLGAAGNAGSLCVALRYLPDTVTLDKECLSLTGGAVLTEAYPNPAAGYLMLQVILPGSGTVRFTLTDRAGATVLSHTDSGASPGLNTYRLDTTPLRAGLYLLTVESGTTLRTLRVMIRK